MKRTISSKWAVILAGGDGKRLEDLTAKVNGERCPKQFSVLVGNQTLLSLTRDRVAAAIAPDHTVVVLMKEHERFYGKELESAPISHAIVQPESRGTAPAILWSLFEIAEYEPTATIAVLPSDHFYSDEARFLSALDNAYDEAERTQQVVILGARPTGPEISLGWIETAGTSRGAESVPIARMWEKPARSTAEKLFRQGCLWNTFVMVGPLQGFLDLIQDATPELFQRIARQDVDAIGEAYKHIPPIDFSHDVLVPGFRSLRTLSLGDVGWSDLGEPRRAMAVVAEHGTRIQKARAREFAISA
jgi:mannose-1-phosphate guanylyltransferase